ncbi:carbon starvation protein A [Leptolinea tardivitalis]|uniref:Carbon starvation protein CstA n=1 Tax=Leptolinea tardivitalis TaxID=229920 RepID=A0A0P6XMV5_9CHLR|nr:carbon starvation CstA family protein [Leptolinea tardivitalis]KPL73281.1 carbon starvation protein CstA [Leptolinea tardivitalis]GAP21403.1 carbon starvation protein, predicted membrane protein [Leptolinea tardivitalis]
MSIIFIVLGGSVIFYLAYITYGKFVATKVYELDDKRVTPAVEMEDGLDYEPIESKFLLGQHFSAIAAAGPVTGPILAGIAYGWVPALIWILLGSIFIGGVHDMGALMASVRNKGRSITETVRVHVSKSAWVLFNLFIFFALVLVIVAFTDVTSSSFVNVVELANGETVGGGAIASSSIMYLILPIIMGFLLRYTKLSLKWATIIFLPLVGVAIWAGKYIPVTISGIGDLSPQKVWNLIIMVYCIIAAIVPVWALLQPRGHLGGYFMYASVIVAAIGIIFGGFTIKYPAFTKAFGGNDFWTPMMPMLFITVACGACSGFHALVGSGTTSKQLKKESDAKIIGYGAMLLEGVVALIALSTVMILAKDNELLKKSPNFVYASGIGAFMQLIGVSPAFGISFGLMAFTTFVYDTLDICVRLGRFIIQELTGWKGWFGRILSTAIMGGLPVFLMTVNMTDAEGKPVAAWSIFWKTFGASNQLLAALALIGITIWLVNTAKNKKAWLVTFLPAVFMFIMSTWALINMFIQYTTKDGAWIGFPAGANIIIPITCAIYVILAVWMAVETINAFNKSHKGGAGTVVAEKA